MPWWTGEFAGQSPGGDPYSGKPVLAEKHVSSAGEASISKKQSFPIMADDVTYTVTTETQEARGTLKPLGDTQRTTGHRPGL